MADPVQSVEFKRSGGAYFQTIRGSAVVGEGKGEVTSDAPGSARPLSAQEADMLRHLDIERLRQSPFAGKDVPGAPDRYQYDVTLTGASGTRVELRFSETPTAELDEKAPGLGALAEWVRTEIDRLWKQRASGRSPTP